MTVLLSLLLGLLLCGCAREPTPVPPPTTEVLTEAPPPVKLPAALGDGALVPIFGEGRELTGVRGLADTLLVFSGSERTTLTAVRESEVSCQELPLSFYLDSRDPSLRLGDRDFSFFDMDARQTVVLDEALQEILRIDAPGDLSGVPLLSGDQRTLFYASHGGIYAWDLESDLRRCLKQIAFPGQSLVGLCMEDTVLQLRIPEGDQVRTLFLSAATGRILREIPGEVPLWGQDDNFRVLLPWGSGTRALFGNGSGTQFFLPRDPGSRCQFLERQPGAVTWSAALPGELTLESYDLPSGERRASLTLQTWETPLAIADTDKSLYILTRGPDLCHPVLYRWDRAKNALADPMVYTAPYAAVPDGEALAQCQRYARELGARYGITLLLGKEAAAEKPRGYTLIPETQPGILMRELALLEERLARYPSGMLSDAADHFSSLTVCLVRQITGPEGNLDQLEFTQDDAARVVVALGEAAERGLYHGLYLALETHILTRSAALDGWDAPQGILPREDRAAVMAQAMLPGNEAVFQTQEMEKKLSALCQGIREAWRWKKRSETFPWEQYLENRQF